MSSALADQAPSSEAEPRRQTQVLWWQGLLVAPDMASDDPGPGTVQGSNQEHRETGSETGLERRLQGMLEGSIQETSYWYHVVCMLLY